MGVNDMNLAPRCKATSKRTGQRCKAPAVKGKKVCRFHGAYAGAPCGEKHGRYIHGMRTKKMLAERRVLSHLISECNSTIAQISE